MLLLWATHVPAQHISPSAGILEQIVVTGKKIESDEIVAGQVQTALGSDPLVFDEHVTVTVKNGIATLHGIAFDYWDVLRMKRLAKRVPGVKRVVDDIDLRIGGD